MVEFQRRYEKATWGFAQGLIYQGIMPHESRIKPERGAALRAFARQQSRCSERTPLRC
jgi:hypothetical protein